MFWSGRRPFAWAYLGILWIGYAIAGWILAAYAAPRLVWLLTLALTVHLAKAGPDAIALSITWVASLLWGAAYIGASPQNMQWTTGHAWGLSLLVLWLLALLLVVLLAFAKQFIPRDISRRSLTLWIWCSFGIGYAIYLWRGLLWLG